jgi:hypothetical protein
MTTYSERLAPLRAFLKDNKAQPNGQVVLGHGDTIEQWNVYPGRPLIVMIDADGGWRACSPISTSDEPKAREHLDRYLLGSRPDLDLLGDMDRLSAAFLAKLADFPACSDPDCRQAICEETRALHRNVQAFQDKLRPTKTAKEATVARTA